MNACDEKIPLLCDRCGEEIIPDRRFYDLGELSDLLLAHWDKCSPGWEEDVVRGGE